MKNLRRAFLVIALFTFARVNAQTFPVDTIAKTGSMNNRINLVFIGDGYKESQMGLFSTDVGNFATGIFSQTPFKEYKSYFNLFAIKVPSTDSGVKHPQNTSDSDCAGVPVSNPDNYFGSSFDTDGIHRLLVPTQYGKVFSVLSTNLPLYDQAFIIVNTPYYGGSGGSFATSSTNSSANEVAIHEMGHSFAFLADEYWVGPGYAVEKLNMTKESDPLKVKWKNWLNTDGVGIFSYSEDASWHRPNQDCKMRYLNRPFCDVCREAFVERIHDLVNPVESFLPANPDVHVASDDINFSLTTVAPEPNTLKISWLQDELVVKKNSTTFEITPATIPVGITKVKATVLDTITISRSDTHVTKHLRVTTWTLTKNIVTGIEISPSEQHYSLSVYPNPIDETFSIKYQLSAPGNVRMFVTDMLGKHIKTLVNDNQAAGMHELMTSADSLHMTGGVYLLTLSVDGAEFSQRLLKK